MSIESSIQEQVFALGRTTLELSEEMGISQDRINSALCEYGGVEGWEKRTGLKAIGNGTIARTNNQTEKKEGED